MAKILLIKPNPCNEDWLQITPPLGVMYLASALRQEGKHDVRILDLRLVSDPTPRAIGELRNFNPDIIGISAFSMEAQAIEDLCRSLCALPGKRHMVMGGPFPTSSPEAALNNPYIDVAILGEGEVTFSQLAEHFEFHVPENLEDIPGIAFRKDGEICLTAPREEIQDVDCLPYPAWDLVDIDVYERTERFSNVRKNRYMPVFTSRSCPYQCVYCHNIFGKGFRPRSPENVVDEIEELVTKHHIREIEIIDDIFNLDSQRAEAICDLILERNLKIKMSFPNALRADLLQEPLLRKLKKVGTHFMAVAVETGSPRLQKAIRKNLDLEKVNQAINMASKLGITTLGYFMLGFPTETREEIMQTVDFACRSRLNFLSFFTVTPIEGTRLWEMCQGQIQAMGVIGDRDYHRNTFNLSLVDDEEFSQIKRSAYKRFYSKIVTRVLLSGAFLDISSSNILRLAFKRVL